jgi:8-oxo-dGTP diphosphatase
MADSNETTHEYKRPATASDVIIELDRGGIVLIERRNHPPGWAIPGGFIEYGESAEAAAVREALEETCLAVTLIEQLHTYSRPDRDPRQHTITMVFIGRATGTPVGADDAARAIICDESSLPSPLAFDHAQVLADYFHYRRTGRKPRYDE